MCVFTAMHSLHVHHPAAGWAPERKHRHVWEQEGSVFGGCSPVFEPHPLTLPEELYSPPSPWCFCNRNKQKEAISAFCVIIKRKEHISCKNKIQIKK